MSRLAPPLILLAALAAGRAHAQAGDRYGPRPAPYAGAAAAYVPAAYAPGAAAPVLRGPPPQLRSLSWPGKAELRPALAPDPVAPQGRPVASPPAPAGRFPSLGAYAAPPPGLRTGPAAVTTTPAPSSPWPAPARVARRPGPGPAAAAAYAPPPRRAPAYAYAPQAAPTGDAMSAPSGTPALALQAGGSTLPPGMAAGPAYVAAGPAYGSALAAQARMQAQAAGAPTADTLPPPTVGRYGYVGPGRTASAAANAPAPTAPAAAAPRAPDPTAAGGLGPPRPPGYARAYVMPSASAAPADSASPAPAAPGPVAALRAGEGGRRYSVHREYGMEPDPVPVPPQFFSATADLSAPETAAPAVVHNRAGVNAARLAADNP